MNIAEGKNKPIRAITTSDITADRLSRKNMNAKKSGDIKARGVAETIPFRIQRLWFSIRLLKKAALGTFSNCIETPNENAVASNPKAIGNSLLNKNGSIP